MSAEDNYWPDALEFWPEPDLNSLLSGLPNHQGAMGSEQEQHHRNHQQQQGGVAHLPACMPHLFQQHNPGVSRAEDTSTVFDASSAAAAAAAAVAGGGGASNHPLLFSQSLGGTTASDAAGGSSAYSFQPQLPSLPGLPPHHAHLGGIPGLMQPHQQFLSLPSNSGTNSGGEQGESSC